MQITRQADYALRAVLYLTRAQPNQRISTTQIAEFQKIPNSFLAKIISQLSIAGLLITSRGAHGGVLLAKKPEEITILDVVEAIDGPVKVNDCTNNPEVCPFGASCPIHDVWCEAQLELIGKLQATTFADLLQRDKQKNRL
jgi:Rrf2 family protein